MKIRPLIPEDLQQLQVLCRQHTEFEKADLENDVQRVQRWRVSLFGSNPKAHVWVAESQNELCGYVSVACEYSTWTGSQFAHLDCLFVTATFRQRGIGRRLIQIVIGFCKAQKIERLEWQTPAWNEDATCFYESLGATWKPKRRFQLRIEGIKNDEA